MPPWATCTPTATRTTGSIRATARIVARNIAEALAQRRPGARRRLPRARRRLREAGRGCLVARTKAVADALPVKAIFTYHRSWVYFANAFGLEVAGDGRAGARAFRRPASTCRSWSTIAKARKVPVLLQEPYFSDDAGTVPGARGGLRVVEVSPSCDDAAGGQLPGALRAVLGRRSPTTGSSEEDHR